MKNALGSYVSEKHVATLISGEPTDVYLPDGSLLLRYRPGVLDPRVCKTARVSLRGVGKKFNDHRMIHTGSIGYNAKGNPDGPNGVRCHKSNFTRSNFNKWFNALPYIRALDSAYREYAPEYYQLQKELIDQTNPNYRISDTVFTTGVANLWDPLHDSRTPLHYDTQNHSDGLGVLSVLSTGDYTGGHLVFYKWGVAVDMRTTDVLLADTKHHAHANTPIKFRIGHERLCTILYYKQLMQHC